MRRNRKKGKNTSFFGGGGGMSTQSLRKGSPTDPHSRNRIKLRLWVCCGESCDCENLKREKKRNSRRAQKGGPPRPPERQFKPAGLTPADLSRATDQTHRFGTITKKRTDLSQQIGKGYKEVGHELAGLGTRESRDWGQGRELVIQEGRGKSYSDSSAKMWLGKARRVN